MLRIPLANLVTLLANLAYEPVQAAEPIQRINCKAHEPEWPLDPVGTGPLQLAAVHCHASPARGSSKVPLASPDARSIAYYDDDKIARIMRLDGSQTETDQNAEMSTFARFGTYSRSASAVRWSSNGEFIWAANHETIRPNGFATSALRPIKLTLHGTVQTLPELRHDAGPLDALLWVDGDGLAVAQFGTRGGYYRPEHDDKAPMFAIVDAERGLVRDTLPFSTIEAFEAFKRRIGGISPGVFVKLCPPPMSMKSTTEWRSRRTDRAC